MKAKNTILFVSGAAILFAALFVFFSQHPVFAPRPVQQSFSSSSPKSETKSKVVAVVVPHHAPVSALIDEVIQKIQWQPKTIIMIGPNHPDAGGARVITGISDPERKFLFDEASIQKLVSSGMSLRSDIVIQKEHSIGVPLSIFARYFPEVKFLPIILSSQNKQKDAEFLAKFLEKNFDDETLLVASIDFSHYLPSDLTKGKDEQTLSWIETRNYPALEKLNNDFADSPASLMTVLKVLDALGTTNMTVVQNTNSGLYAGEPIASSTSYITLLFTLSTNP